MRRKRLRRPDFMIELGVCKRGDGLVRFWNLAAFSHFNSPQIRRASPRPYCAGMALALTSRPSPERTRNRYRPPLSVCEVKIPSSAMNRYWP